MLTRLLLRHLRPYRKQIAGVVGLQLISVMSVLYLPSINADLINRGIVTGDIGYIWSSGAKMLAFTGLQGLCSIGAVYLGARAAMGVGRDIRAAIVHKVSGFSDQEVGKYGVPSLITRSTNDVQQVQMLVVMSATILVLAPIMCIGGVAMALYEDVHLSWILGVAVPLLGISMAFLISKMVPGYRIQQKRIDGINRVLREQITGIRVVRAFVREESETRRFQQANLDLTEVAVGVGRLGALMFPLVMLISNVSSVAVIWFGGHEVASGTTEIGSLTAMLSYIMQVLMSVMMASFLAMMVPRAEVCAERITEVLNSDISVDAPRNPQPMTEHPGKVEFSFAEFRYPGAESAVLREISFTATPGTTTAIIGATGSGKTTLVSLIPRLLDVTEGAVYVGGTDVRHLAPELLRSHIGYVPQKAFLFTGTVASNLRFGRDDATDEELWRCLEIAQAADFIRELPEGLESPVTQGGTNFSGGQRQRLAIARALVKQPDVYLFDDSFSALDLATDSRLRAALEPHTYDATVIIVAQRVSTIRGADRIIVLEHGRIVGIGRHDELVENCPCYAEIVDSQLAVQDAR